MSKEEKHSAEEGQNKESILDFEEAKEMTVGQASRKSEEYEAGVNDDDNVLDKYIKQHRQEIEAGKFEALENTQGKFTGSTLELEDLIKEIRSETRLDSDEKTVEQEEQAEATAMATEEVASEQSASTLEEGTEAEVAQAFSELPLEQTEVTQVESTEESTDLSAAAQAEEDTIPIKDLPSSLQRSRATAYADDEFDDEKPPFYKNKKVIYSAVAALVLLVGGTTYFVLNNRTQTGKTTTSSSTASSSKTSSSSESNDLKAFNDLYDSFFTDNNKIAVKNSSFGDLPKLKAALDKLNGSNEYNVAKARYDSLAKQIEAIQAVNSQFETAAITDGVLNTNAKAKSDAKFTDTTTGNDTLDKLLKSAISQGKGQQTVAPSNSSAAAPATEASQAASPAPTNPAPTAGANSNQAAATISSPTPYGGLPSTGVNLQRPLSRVPYNQAAIDDATNSAWTFNPGVLENILNISRQRGYITGDQYILERVNIVKGNGYYNLFKPDGTYLFSINCKTGYFVGNGPGYADSLDY